VPIPEAVKSEALRTVEAFCEERVPADLSDELRLECSQRGNDITIVERRPPWRPDIGPEWTTSSVARLRYHPDSRKWSLRAPLSNGRWFDYEGGDHYADIRVLLAMIDADRTGIFWG
jgi:DUF3024 family protein